LLHCYTNQDDLFVCTPTANRNRAETKGLIGYFVNLLVLRTDLSGNPSFRELLSRMRKVISGAYAHQDLPVVRLVDCLNLVHTPLSQVMFVLQNVPTQPLKLSGLTVTSLEIDNGMADFDLFLSMQEEAENLTGVLKYNTDLFDDATITLMLKQFQLLLSSIVSNPDQPLSSLPLLPETEWHRKMERSALPAFDQPRFENSGSLSEYVAPRDTFELQLTQIWSEVLGVQPLGVRDNFFDLGGRSLLAVRLFAQIKKIFGFDLPLATLFQAPTVEQQANLLQQSERSAPWELLVKIQSGDSKPPLFIIHGGYSSVLMFYKLAGYLGSKQPVYGLQPQGLDEKQIPQTRIEDMAADYIREIRTVQPQGPYFLGGFSMGGKVAFEMAQRLHAQGQEVAMLALFDTLGTGWLQPLPVHVRASRHLANLLRLELKEKLTYLKQKLTRRFDSDNSQPLPNKKAVDVDCGKPSDDSAVSPEAKHISALKAAHDQANKDYVPKVYPGRAILFRVREPFAGDWSQWCEVDPKLGWGKLVAGGLEIQEVPGNHMNMFDEPYVQVLAKKLQASLDRSQADD